MQTPDNILALIEKYQAGTITPAEKTQLNDWYHSFNDTEVEIEGNEIPDEQQLHDRIKARLDKTIGQGSKNEVVPASNARRWRLPAIAAAVVILVFSGVSLLIFTRSTAVDVAASKKGSAVNLVQPGGDKAILTLANGSTIVLDSLAKGTISQAGNIKVQQLNNGLLAYTITATEPQESTETLFNTITTPRGGQYQVTLTDGTKVWLNAASSIRFPVVFKGPERIVEITGEAYFEVAKMSGMPFKVKALSAEIEVLGTHFNVNAYSDEHLLKATLLEGLVKVSALSAPGKSSAKFIQPGQQAEVDKAGVIDIVDRADTEEAMAWKNGRFQFKSTDLKTVLRQISRWYDVDIVYNAQVNLHFTGQLSRSESASRIFDMLALTGEVHFKMEGKTVIVSP